MTANWCKISLGLMKSVLELVVMVGQPSEYLNQYTTLFLEGGHLWHTKVSRLGIESELHLQHTQQLR